MTEAMTSSSTDLVPAVEGIASAVPEAEFARLLGFPANAGIDAHLREIMDYVRERFTAVGRPWVQARLIEVSRLTDEETHLDEGTILHCPILAKRLADAKAHAVVIVGVSAGPEVVEEIDHRWQSDKPDSSYFLDALSSCVVERLMLTTGIHLCEWGEPLGLAALPHYSPGYVSWPLREQRILLKLLKDEAPLPGPMEALETGMLKPSKSQLAAFGMTRHRDLLEREPDLCPCVDCGFSPCAYRRMPQRQATKKARTAGQTKAATPSPEPLVVASLAAAPLPGVYEYPEKALQRWNRECLDLAPIEDGKTLARFRYLGSTCGGAGADLVFDFVVKLGNQEDQYRILETDCVAPVGDESHTRACAYIVNGEALRERMQAYRPLVGHPLDDVLTWDPDLKMSGCMCSTLDQAHKWRVALQAIHYGVTHRKAASA